MAPKRSLKASEPESSAKKAKHGFRVGPENLPDGPWRRKVTKIKKELIHKAKVKKAYSKLKVREQEAALSKPQLAAVDNDAHDEAQEEDKEAEEQLHPTRKLMIADEDKAQENVEADAESNHKGDGQRRRTRRPGYYDKQLKKADERKKEAEERQQEFQRRREERERKLADRERFKKAMAKTRDRDGNKKLGRESTLLLDKVKRMMADK
ncbi:hypothetical protein B0T10DRAFT_226488 [Thelonectria olida]|uniref:rRNA-processing protein FYV7 n=1 Tax=Thelonectria olida TaxID=1576542 RepID=A0A9P9AWH6_9HYPO|nr:hypothetical protein B0T10DRAFT_226488 [Thelonectria olida]